MSAVLARIAADIERIAARLDALDAARDEVILTRAQAAKALKVSVRQLQRLVAAGRLLPHPSGIARAELERYAKTPQTPLPKVVTRATHLRTADEEADRLEQMISLRRRKKS